jgi:hypothetical protein
VEGVGRQHQLSWGAGVEWPLIRPSLRVLAELTGIHFAGEKQWELVNAVSPIDTNLGGRIRISSCLTVSAALNIHLKNSPPNMVASNRFGWIFQASFQRKVNRPPVVECGLARRTAVEGETIILRARLSDPDDDALWLSWLSNGGRLSQEGVSVRLDTTGMEPGRYSVMAEVGDESNVSSCSVDIIVVKPE